MNVSQQKPCIGVGDNRHRFVVFLFVLMVPFSSLDRGGDLEALSRLLQNPALDWSSALDDTL